MIQLFLVVDRRRVNDASFSLSLANTTEEVSSFPLSCLLRFFISIAQCLVIRIVRSVAQFHAALELVVSDFQHVSRRLLISLGLRLCLVDSLFRQQQRDRTHLVDAPSVFRAMSRTVPASRVFF